MAELTGIAYTLVTSPRIAESPASVDEVTVQDALDTLSKKQSDIDVIGATPGVDNTVLVGGSGKDDLGGGVTVGITSTFDNLQWAFASDYTATESGTATSVGTTTLIDLTATFITKGITRGAAIINYDDRSIAEVLEVISETEIRHRVLNNGSNNDWTIGDNYTIHNIIQKSIAGGNQVAKDDLGATISPVFPTAFTQVLLTASSSATSTSQAALEVGLFNGGVAIDTLNGFSGTGSIDGIPIGTRQKPSNNIANAETIAIANSLVKFYLMEDFTLDAQDLSEGYLFIGDSLFLELTLATDANMTNNNFESLTVIGESDGSNTFKNCIINDTTKVSGLVENCGLKGTTSLSGDTTFNNCYSLAPGSGKPNVNINGAWNMIFRKFDGSIGIEGATGGIHTITLNAGRPVFAPSCTDGEFSCRGILSHPIEDNSGPNCRITDDALHSWELHELHRIQGLDRLNPMTVTKTSRVSGDIELEITGDGVNTSTVTRGITPVALVDENHNNVVDELANQLAG